MDSSEGFQGLRYQLFAIGGACRPEGNLLPDRHRHPLTPLGGLLGARRGLDWD